MTDTSGTGDGRFGEDVRGWAVHHFALTHRGEDVTSLLRDVGRRLDELDTASVVGLTFSSCWSQDREITITVYLDMADAGGE